MIRGAGKTLLLLTLAAAGLSQSEEQPYFSLASMKTFPSGGKPTLEVTSTHVESLEFRVYRVQDPVKFFGQIEDSHQFGGRAEAPPRERTTLEKLRSWKRGMRANILRSLRGQFSEPPSDHLSFVPHTAAKPVVSTGVHYAETPLLNSQQLVLSFMQPVQGQNRWERETVDIGVEDKGVYLVEAVHKALRAYTILMVSDTVMITKSARGRTVNIVVDRKTGEPVAGAKVTMVGRDVDIRSAETNRDGIAEIPLPKGQPEDVRLVAKRGVDVAVNSTQGWGFGGDEGIGTIGADFRGYIYTDRPVYRPGHTVHFKAVLRMRTATGYDVPAGKPATVQIQDSDQKTVYQKSLGVSANGTIHDEFVLGASASLGSYNVEVHLGDNQASNFFDVEEYKKPEYEVRVTASKARVLEGEKVQATIDAKYYFGEPVNNAKVEWSIYRDHYFNSQFYDPDDQDFEMGTAPEDRESSGDQVAQGEGQLDGEGKLTIPVETTISEHKADYIYRVEAKVTDQGKREISGKGYVIATYGSFAVSVAPREYFYQPGDRGTFIVQARDYDGNPMRAKVRVEMMHWDWRKSSDETVVATTEVDTGAGGSANAEMAIPANKAGGYRVRVVTRTPEGRDVQNWAYIWVTGATPFEFESQDNSVQIVPNKKTFQAGDTAKVLIVTGQANVPVYVTVEGRDLRQIKLVRSKGSMAEFEVPVAPSDEPGIHVAASFVRGGKVFSGSKYLRVPPVSHQLNVKIATDKPQYLPGETAEYHIEVMGTDGKPAPKAEFSLGVVDEAIYAIRKDFTQDPLAFFFGREYNAVSTNDSLTYYFYGEAGTRRMRLANVRPHSRLAQLKPERLVQPKIRKVFPDTAFWATDLVTDSGGRAYAKVTFPDSLTTWRATARGTTFDTKVGAATSKTIVRKNLILRLVVPRFFVQGDELTISALVHNYLTSAKTARVSLDLTGLDVLDGATKDVQIPSRGEAKVDWRVRVQKVRTATLLGKALTDEESDALQLDLPVNVPGIKMSSARGGTLSGGGSDAYDVSFPANVEPGSRSIAVRLSPSIAGSLFNAVDYLTTFPYGCVEQTMSSFLPNIIVTGALKELKLKVAYDEAGLQQKIRAGLDRLYMFQHEDGGWGWWQTDESHPFMTAYVVAGLAQAKRAGVQVDDSVIDKGAQWVRQRSVTGAPIGADLRAYMEYSLALAYPGMHKSDVDQAYARRPQMSAYGLAFLGLTMELEKDQRAGEIAAAVEGMAKQDQEQAWWPATRDSMLDFDADASPEATAYAVKLLSHVKQDSPLLPKAAVWLMNHRNEGYWWYSTKQTAMVIYGLTDFLKTTNEMNPNLTVTVFVNDAPVVTKKLDSATEISAGDIVIDESKLQPAVNHVRVVTSGQGHLYYSTRAEYYSIDQKLQKSGNVSLNILRDYYRLTPGKAGDRIVWDTAPLNGPVASGDILAVRLTVTGTEWKYVMIEDPIPAGTEFIERDDLYQMRQKPDWWTYYFSRRELHDDRMAIFETYFPKGQQQFFYLLKVVNPGTFKVSPAKVGPMYQTDVMATTESRTLEVKQPGEVK